MGHKIKKFAKVLMILGMIPCGILAIIHFFQYYENHGWIQFATINGGASFPFTEVHEHLGNKGYASLQTMIYFICGFFACLLGGLPLYWFGCLFERVESIEQNILYMQKSNANKQ